MTTWDDLAAIIGFPAVPTSRVRRLLDQAADVCGEDLAPLNRYMSEAKAQRMTLEEGLEFAIERLRRPSMSTPCTR